MMKTAILLSGGMDSAAIAAWQRPEVGITVDYGQRSAQGEIRASREIARVLSIEHHVLCVDCRLLGSGDMAGSQQIDIAPVPEWWPFRNQLLVTLAAMKAVTIGVKTLLVGSVAADSQHIDGSMQFYDALDQVVSMQEGGIRVIVPAIGMTTAELVQVSGISRETLAWCHSCHVDEFACGRCRGCNKHAQVRIELGMGDVRITREEA